MTGRLAVLGFAVIWFSVSASAPAVGPAEATITGTVVDETEKPVAGVAVRAIGNEPAEPVTTGDDGKFQLALAVNARQRISVELLAAKGEDRLGVLSINREVNELRPVEIVLKPAQTVTVTVADDAGAPVPNAEVHVLSGLRSIATGRTDAAGRWSGWVPADARESRWGVFAFKAQAGFDYFVPPSKGHGTATPTVLPDEVPLVLDGAATVRVKTVGPAGRPLIGISVVPWYIRKPGREDDVNLSGVPAMHSATGADGVAVFDWVPASVERKLLITVHSETHSATEPGSIDLAAGEREVTMSLVPNETISGRVTHADGRPAAGVLVRAQGRGVVHWSGRSAATTGADGRYEMQVMPDQAYIVAVQHEQSAAPYRSPVVVRPFRPARDVDFKLAPATRLHGRVTVGLEARPVPDTSIMVYIDAGNIPEEIRALSKDDSRSYYGLTMAFHAQTDSDGRYEFFLGPGDYRIEGPVRTNAVEITIPANSAAAEMVQNFHMERPATGPLTVTVVDTTGKPVAGANVTGYYYHEFDAQMHGQGWDEPVKTDAAGRLTTERALDRLVLHAINDDGSLAGVAQLDPEESEATVVISPTATRTGRLLSPNGDPLVGKTLEYSVSIATTWDGHEGEKSAFGGEATTDSASRFTLTGLVPGENYRVLIKLDTKGPFVSRGIMTVTPMKAQAVDLGDVKLDF